MKKRKKRLVFKEYVLSIYGMDAVRETAVSMQSYDKFVLNGRLIEQADGQLLLAGFYANDSKKKELNGFFINKLNVQSGEMTLSSFKEINAGMLGKNFVEQDDDDEDSKKEKKEMEKTSKNDDDDDEEELPNYLIRSVDVSPADGSIIITGEVSTYRKTYHTTYSGTGTYRSVQTYTIHRFYNKDILVISADKDGNIRWVNDIPKSQRELFRTEGMYTPPFLGYLDAGYFVPTGAMPYYSSYVSLLHKNSLLIILNDHADNSDIAQFGGKVKTIYNFRKRCSAVGVSVDLATGKMTKKFIVTNTDETILMPRHALIQNNELILPSWRIRSIGKTKFKLGKIVVR